MKNLKVFTFTFIAMFLCCMLSAQCPEGDISLTNQQQIDDFAVNYPNCTEVENMTIQGSDISNLNGLSQITMLSGNLTIISTSAERLSGLENLTAVQGDLHIGNLDRTCSSGGGYCEWIDSGNNILTDLSGLEGLSAVGGTLFIVGNDGLNTLTGLHNIETLGGLNIHGNNSLINLTGLGRLKTITGDFELFENYKHLEEVLDLAIGLDEVYRALGSNTLTSFAGLDSLTGIEGDLIIDDNNALVNLSGLEALTYVGEDVIIGTMDVNYIKDWFVYEPSGNDALVGLSGLENLTSIGGRLRIAANPNLPNCMGLDNLQTTGGLQVYENPVLTDLTGLESLTHIEGHLELYYQRWLDVIWYDDAGDNDAMTSLAGLENLNTINGELKIAENDLLNDITAIDNLDHTSITNLILAINENLSVCNTTLICNYLENGGQSEIFDNATGCNSGIEIENACVVSSTSSPYDLYKITTSPNPSTGIFQVNGIPQGTYQIHDTTGRTIQSGNMQNDLSIDISQEARGVYFISIQIENETITKRMIKM